jgi:hypothetical protein
MPNDPTDMVTLKIPRQLYERVGQLIEGTGFRSVTEFATFVLRDLAAQPRASQPPTEKRRQRKRPAARMTRDELKAARKRLQELGYL